MDLTVCTETMDYCSLRKFQLLFCLILSLMSISYYSKTRMQILGHFSYSKVKHNVWPNLTVCLEEWNVLEVRPQALRDQDMKGAIASTGPGGILALGTQPPHCVEARAHGEATCQRSSQQLPLGAPQPESTTG